ncbi:hypothetical protein [Streptomyces sp. NPDC020747]|uniref:hypothetical protein n=1 Tax=Streptomyces sp. NPDC020747 TaxID=3365086 RepID=UPI00378F7556
MSIAVLTACTSEKPPAKTEPPASPVSLKFQRLDDYAKGTPGRILFEVENEGPYREVADIDLSFDFKNAPKGGDGISVEYQEPKSHSWKILRLSPKDAEGAKALEGSYQVPLPRGASTLMLRLTPAARPTTSGQSIGVTANLRSGRKTLASHHGTAPLANLQVVADSGNDYVRREGGWSEYSFSVNNISTVDYPKIQVLASVCKDSEDAWSGDCESDESTSGLHIQWKARDSWKNLETSSEEADPKPDDVDLMEIDTILNTNIPLPPRKSRIIHFRIRATSDFPTGNWSGQLQLLARHKGDESTTEFSVENSSLRVK